MRNYHNQEIIKKTADGIKKLSKEEFDEVIKEIESQIIDARYVANKISVYIPNDERKRRREILYYYEDLLDELKPIDK